MNANQGRPAGGNPGLRAAGQEPTRRSVQIESEKMRRRQSQAEPEQAAPAAEEETDEQSRAHVSASPQFGDLQEEAAVEDAARRQEWLKSDERRRLLKFIWWLVAAVVILTVIGSFVGKLFTPYNRINLLIGGAAGLFIGAYFSYGAGVVRRSQLRRQFGDRTILSKARSDLQQAESEVVSGELTDFLSLWNVTQKRLSYYHDIATAHAERSFLYGQIAAASGFIVLLIGAVIAAFTTTIAGAIAAGIAGISGGGLGAYIGATFMRSQDVAAQQMREYFRQPLEFSKFLSAERLLDSLDGEARVKATQAIIESMIKSDYSTTDS